MRSVLSQSFTDFEYIIMDGASTDDTVKIAESFREDFEKKGVELKIFSERDSGIYDGMNHGVRHAAGEYVNFMNAGDCFFDGDVLEKVFSSDADGADLIYGDAAELEYGSAYLFVKNIEGIYRRMPFSHQSLFARRELLEMHPFNLRYRIAADYDFIVTCYDEGAVFADSHVLVCRVTKDGLSSVKLYDTFLDTERMLAAHSHPRYTPAGLKKKLFFLRIRQFGMDHLPVFVKKLIRVVQRKSRGHDVRVADP
jgi:glycosyltransferase involved in cell wall biosynthesis